MKNAYQELPNLEETASLHSQERKSYLHNPTQSACLQYLNILIATHLEYSMFSYYFGFFEN